MAKHMCHVCYNDAAYISRNSDLALCEECYYSMEDSFDCLGIEEESGMCFDEYYDFEEIED